MPLLRKPLQAEAEDIKLLLTHIHSAAPVSLMAVVPCQELREAFKNAVKKQIEQDANRGAAKVKDDNMSDIEDTWDDEHQQGVAHMFEAIANMKRRD